MSSSANQNQSGLEAIRGMLDGTRPGPAIAEVLNYHISAAEAGVTAIIQPGGSIRDEEVIAAADERDLAMVFTGIRHFNH